MREDSGLTLAQLAELSGYSVSAINGLELRGEGSDRLKKKLLEILQNPQIQQGSHHIPVASPKAPGSSTQQQCQAQFDQIVALCGESQHKLSWTLVELSALHARLRSLKQ